MSKPEAERPNEKDEPESDPPRIVDSRAIFAGCNEIWIEHDGERYRLRITRRGRLILQK